jgi:hypothetical protein
MNFYGDLFASKQLFFVSKYVKSVVKPIWDRHIRIYNK